LAHLKALAPVEGVPGAYGDVAGSVRIFTGLDDIEGILLLILRGAAAEVFLEKDVVALSDRRLVFARAVDEGRIDTG
jgi:hypothetical protein